MRVKHSYRARIERFHSMAQKKSKPATPNTTPTEDSNKSYATGAGVLIIIGGAEDKVGEKQILARVAELARHKKVVVATVASSLPAEVWLDYQKAFRELDVAEVEHMDIPDRDSAFDQ